LAIKLAAILSRDADLDAGKAQESARHPADGLVVRTLGVEAVRQGEDWEGRQAGEAGPRMSSGSLGAIGASGA
jgi:hypothetical protein